MKHTTIAMLLAGLAASGAFAATEADVDASFNPYKNGMPTFPGLTPGMTINKGNVEQFKQALGAGVYKLIKDGLFEIKVGATTDFTLNKAYVNATKANLNKAKLGAGPGQISGYVAGRPFPEEPDLKDPRAGIGADDGFSIVDVQSRQCTTAAFKGRVDPKLSPAEMFQVQYMRGSE